MKTSSTTRSRGTSRFSYHQVATQSACHGVLQPLGMLLEDRDVEIALGAEMVVENRWHDTGARGDVLHLRLGESVLGERFDSRVEDAGPSLRCRYPRPCHTEY